MNEMSEITSHIIRKVGNSAAVIWGVGNDPALGDAISVTIIATGFPTSDIELFDLSAEKKNEEKPAVLKAEEVALKVSLTPAEIRELENIPAYKRRNLRIV